ncbi:MAG TPA: nucleotide exchange factor GrpE [Gemmatimonadales bacterium]|nr:nucleotide exchange factor GrpE [Gemmatimonadales bacterium]
MSKHKKKPPEPDVTELTEPAETTSAAEEAAPAGPALVEIPEEAARRAQEEAAELKDRYLRVAAEFDNFRKRTQRERTETWSRAQAHVVSTILDVLDDLARVARLDPERTAATDVLAGVELVERKLVRELESAGLERVGQPGTPFDPNLHEAVTSLPAPSGEQDHTVAQVFQAGYRFGGGLLRPARVSVYLWQPPSGDGSGEEGEGDGGGGSG